MGGRMRPVSAVVMFAAVLGLACTSSLNNCPSGKAECNGSCVDTLADSANCGMCANSCANGYACVQGMCKQQQQQMMCQGAAPVNCSGTCVNITTDTSHCGGCSTVCASGDSCIKGTCVSPGSCGAFTMCFGQCVDTSTDSNNCGGCGLMCAPGDYCSQSSCVSGSSCLPDGYSCNADGQCCGLLCAGDGLCGCIPSGYSGCSADSDCCSNACDLMSTVCN